MSKTLNQELRTLTAQELRSAKRPKHTFVAGSRAGKGLPAQEWMFFLADSSPEISNSAPRSTVVPGTTAKIGPVCSAGRVSLGSTNCKRRKISRVSPH